MENLSASRARARSCSVTEQMQRRAKLGRAALGSETYATCQTQEQQKNTAPAHAMQLCLS